MDQLITECRDAVPTLGAGVLGAERGVRLGEELTVSELPHVFAHSPAETVDLLDFQQEQRTVQVTLDLWVAGSTQEALLLQLDAIRDQIAGNRSLSGLVDYATVTERRVYEAAARDRKCGRIVVSAVEVV